MSRHRPLAWAIPIGVLLLFVCFSVMWGRYSISMGNAVKILLGGIFPFEKTWTDAMERVVLSIRLPRILMAMLAGLALSLSGAAYQGVFQNPMASPDILGSSNGAAFGAALSILLGLPSAGVMTVSFVTSLLTVMLVYALSRVLKTRRTTGLILSGIMVGSLFSSGTSFIKLVADPTNQLPAITYWLMGSLSGTDWHTLGVVVIPLFLGVLPLLLLSWKVDLLSLGDEDATVLGLDVNRLRRVLVICSTLATSSVIATCGLIGWVGLVVPHLARKVMGSSNTGVFPASALFGALFLLVVDDICRCAASSEIPIGILTAFVGAPFFLALMLKGENHL
ncbi:MAG: iron ABC transporter permease [Sphaerochaetaceae bacterium]